VDRSSVGVVEVVVTSGGSSVDLTEATVTWDGEQRYELTPQDTNVGQGSFSMTGNTTLDEPTDRAILRFDLGSDDLGGLERFGERLDPGETVEFSIVTADGVRTERRLVVPDPLPSGAGTSL
jgi:archaellin